MTALLFAALMSLPLYPVNPTEQDTLNVMNVHITAGVDGPNGVVSTGPELSLKYEMLLFHPLVIRPSLDFQFGSVKGAVFPHGDLSTVTFAAEIFAYRGTDHLTGYLGTGLTYSNFFFSAADRTADSLYDNYRVTDVDLDPTLGYRFTMGLRYRRVYSAEFGVTEIRPQFVFRSKISESQYSQYAQKARMSIVRFTLGYLFPLKLF